MALELVPVTVDRIPALSLIWHQAFSALHDSLGLERDIPTPEVGGMIISHVVKRPDYTGVMAVLDGKIVGSNFLLHADEVAGVGPITVDPPVQAKGIGRALVQWVIDESRRRGIRQTRPFQEALNITSLSLYTSLGFDWRDSAALTQAMPAPEEDPNIRPLGPEDLPRRGRAFAPLLWLLPRLGFRPAFGRGDPRLPPAP